MNGVVLGRAHGTANLVFGLWPLIHLPSFEKVFGPKVDRWLVKTVSGLLVVNGMTQLATSSSRSSVRQARRLGGGTAAVLAAVDLVYVSVGRIRRCTSSTLRSKSAGCWPGDESDCPPRRWRFRGYLPTSLNAWWVLPVRWE